MSDKASNAPTESTGFSSAPDAAALSVPRVFGRLLLLKLMARGGMGDVYLAATTGIEGAERACVVKTVRRDHIRDGSFLARFLDEARVQSQLNHPGVAQVLEAATDENGEPYTVVEYVEGRSLSDVRQRSIQLGARIGWPEAVAIAIEMAQALAHVHERSGADGTPLGIVHRDLSPQNVMIGYAGEVKLIDFGTARGHNRRCHTVAGVVFAKPGYVAPEVARQQVGDGRIDIYALGIMLWELCAAKRFLSGDAQVHLEQAAAGKIVIPLLADTMGIPDDLDKVIAKLTANDPEDRYTNATLAATDLAQVLSGAPPCKLGERGVRSRVHHLMRALWTHEPARGRAEFAKLLREARTVKSSALTPQAGKVSEIALSRMNDDPSILSGTPYKLVRKIGEGASGIVHEAEHVELGRRVAIKILAPEHASATDAIERFRREARAVAALSHPNLCMLYDFGKAYDGRIFLAMELLTGDTLDKRLKETRGMDWREAVALAIEVTKALEAAHGAGLVHRDLKPQNLFLTADGGLKLLDFGVAMALSDVSSQEGRQKGFAIFGTPEYMAPEQVAGDPVDGRCDLYALGCVLYELVTGHRPFEGTSTVAVMGKQLREVPEPPRARAPMRGIPDVLDAIIMTALAKSPANRFANAQAMRESLEETLHTPTTREKKVRRAAGAAFAGMALIAMTTFAVRASHHAVEVGPVQVADARPEPMAPTTSMLPESLVAEVAQMSASVPLAMEAAAEMAVIRAKPENEHPKDRGAGPRPEVRAELEHALAEARTAAKAHPGDTRALKAWASAAMRAGDFREARRAADVWALHDGSAEPRIFLATALDASGRRGDAKAVLEEILEIHPDAQDARRLHARYGAPLPSLDTAPHKSSLARR